MSSIGTGYDLAASTFSPEGRIFQVEYAQKAVDASSTVVSLASKNGVVTAIEKTITSKLCIEDDGRRINNVTTMIGISGTGYYPDYRSLLNYSHEESSKYLKEFRDVIPVKKLADTIAEYVHIFTLGISRPFGVSVNILSWNEDDGSSLYCVEPSGLGYKYKAWSIGKNSQAAKTEIEKLTDSLNDFTLQQLLDESIRILLTVRDEKQKNLMIEAGWVGDTSKGLFKIVDRDRVRISEDMAKQRIEAEEDA